MTTPPPTRRRPSPAQDASSSATPDGTTSPTGAGSESTTDDVVGSTDDDVHPPPAVDFAEQDPVAIGEPSPLGADFTATVTKVETVELEARGPGQTAGHGVAITVRLRNGRGDAIDVSGIVVNASHGDGSPASPNFGPPSTPFEGVLAPGEQADAVYAFRLEPNQLDSLVLDIHHDRSPNVVIVEAGGA